jgi:hypothetical protein
MAELSRRRVLAGAIALPALAAACCRPASASDSVAPADLLNIGTGGRVRGVNITPGPDDWGGASPWAELWSRWEWNGRIKNELDDAVTVGANCVGLIGNTHVVTSDTVPMARYLQQWTQFLDYTKNCGLWVYPCGGDLAHWGHTTLDAAESVYRGWAEMLASYNHVIGVNITNEAPSQARARGAIAYAEPEPWYDTVKRLGELVRTTAEKPITHSRSITAASGSWQFGSPDTDKISDFLDVHVYDAPSPNDADALLASDWGAGKQLILGEFGVDMTADSPSRTAFFNAVKALISHSARCVGGLVWAIYDTDDTPAGGFGLYDANRAARTDIATPFATFPSTR